VKKIAIYNLESKYINIALEKIKIYHESQGDYVENYFALNHDNYDKIYCSSIFDFTDKQYVTDDMICGGTGFYDELGITKLPKKIDEIKLKKNIGFTQRGCCWSCDFCLVNKFEKLKIVGDIYDIWDGESKEIVLLDNNPLAIPKHFEKICKQIKKENLIVDFNQGLDIRLINKKQCELLKSIKMKEYRFAFDNDNLFSIVKEKIKLLNKYKIKALWYVLVGFNSTFNNELKRINYLHSCGQRAYVMRHKKCDNDKRYIALANWCNSPLGFKVMDFYTEYLKCQRGKLYKKYFKVK
jgi:hypothetical protein